MNKGKNDVGIWWFDLEIRVTRHYTVEGKITKFKKHHYKTIIKTHSLFINWYLSYNFRTTGSYTVIFPPNSKY